MSAFSVVSLVLLAIVSFMYGRICAYQSVVGRVRREISSWGMARVILLGLVLTSVIAGAVFVCQARIHMLPMRDVGLTTFIVSALFLIHVPAGLRAGKQWEEEMAEDAIAQSTSDQVPG